MKRVILASIIAFSAGNYCFALFKKTAALEVSVDTPEMSVFAVSSVILEDNKSIESIDFNKGVVITGWHEKHDGLVKIKFKLKFSFDKDKKIIICDSIDKQNYDSGRMAWEDNSSFLFFDRQKYINSYLTKAGEKLKTEKQTIISNFISNPALLLTSLVSMTELGIEVWADEYFKGNKIVLKGNIYKVEKHNDSPEYKYKLTLMNRAPKPESNDSIYITFLTDDSNVIKLSKEDEFIASGLAQNIYIDRIGYSQVVYVTIVDKK